MFGGLVFRVWGCRKDLARVVRVDRKRMALSSVGQAIPCSASQMSPMPASSSAIHLAHGYEKRASAFGFCWGQNSRTSAMSDGLLSICPLRRVLTLSDDCHVIVTLRHDIEQL